MNVDVSGVLQDLAIKKLINLTVVWNLGSLDSFLSTLFDKDFFLWNNSSHFSENKQIRRDFTRFYFVRSHQKMTQVLETVYKFLFMYIAK